MFLWRCWFVTILGASNLCFASLLARTRSRSHSYALDILIDVALVSVATWASITQYSSTAMVLPYPASDPRPFSLDLVVGLEAASYIGYTVTDTIHGKLHMVPHHMFAMLAIGIADWAGYAYGIALLCAIFNASTPFLTAAKWAKHKDSNALQTAMFVPFACAFFAFRICAIPVVVLHNIWALGSIFQIFPHGIMVASLAALYIMQWKWYGKIWSIAIEQLRPQCIPKLHAP